MGRFLLPGILSGHRPVIILISLLLLPPAFLVSSCRREIPDPPPEEEQAVTRDSVLTMIHIDPAAHPVGHIDLLIYDSGGTGQLECHKRIEGLPGDMGIVTVEGEKRIAVIANSPKVLSLAALSRYDALSQLGYGFESDNPQLPLMGGVCLTEKHSGRISLSPLLCEVELHEIGNTLEDYELLESPRVRLRGINSNARIMQQSGFYPEESMDYGEWQELPYDIGMLPQYPEIRMYCYPNETPETTFGTAHTSLELECTIMGTVMNFEVNLPPFGRNSRLKVTITVNGPYDFDSDVSVENL